jgi:predicted Zn-dependent peptidase
LVVAGDISEAELRELAQRLFGRWSASLPPVGRPRKRSRAGFANG